MIKALEQIRRMRGGAQSHLMRCSDENYYVVKFQNNPQHRRILVNELLGTRLASRLGLPTAPVEVVEVGAELIRLTPDLCIELPRSRTPCAAGLQFGSRYPGDPRRMTLHDFLPDEKLREVRNLHDFAGMLVFDKWVCNTNGRQTVFFEDVARGGGTPVAALADATPGEVARGTFPEGETMRGEAGRGRVYKTVMIDQGFCFNAVEWNFPDAPLRGLYARSRVYEGVTGMDSFGPWLERLEKRITEKVLGELAEEIPAAWYEDDYDAVLRVQSSCTAGRSRWKNLFCRRRVRTGSRLPHGDNGLRGRTMSTQAQVTGAGDRMLAYRVLRYTPNLVRDEWVNIGVLVFDPQSGERRMRLIEEPEEYARVRRLHPRADEELLRTLRDDLESRFASAAQLFPADSNAGGNGQARLDWLRLLGKWDETLSNALQLAPQKGIHAEDLDAETERLYADHVALQRGEARVGAPGSRGAIRSYCAQVFKQARLWERLQKGLPAAEFTFSGDPMRIDYGYRRNGTRGFVQTLSVSRAPGDVKSLAYTVERIRGKVAASEFTAVTDVHLIAENERHQFVRETLRDAGVEAVPLEGLAVWTARMRPMIQ